MRITSPINAWLQRARADSPRAQQLCGQLAGKSLAIEVIGSPWALLLTVEAEALTATLVAPEAADAASLSLRGGLVGLITALRADVQRMVDRGQLGFRGDHALAAPFQELVGLLRPDLETQLTRAFGPVPGHYAVRGLESIAGWGRAAVDSFLRTGSEFLAHESRDLVPRPEAEGYLEGVTALRLRVNAAEQRIADLEARLATLPGKPPGRP
jgi:ubiquinone biosynthesis protein UbiJ